MSRSHANPHPPQPAARPQHLRGAPSRLSNVVAVLLVIALGVYAHARLSRITVEADPGPVAAPAGAVAAEQAPDFVRACDVRTQCFQMTSCAEAKYFLENCPGVQMDANRNGVPCERQWCTSLLAK